MLTHRCTCTKCLAWLIGSEDPSVEWGLGCQLCLKHLAGSSPIGVILELYRDNGKENGNYYNGLYIGFRVQGFGFRVCRKRQAGALQVTDLQTTACQSYARQAMSCSISPVQAESDDGPEMAQDAPAAALVHLSVEASCRLTDTYSTEKSTKQRRKTWEVSSPTQRLQYNSMGVLTQVKLVMDLCKKYLRQ